MSKHNSSIQEVLTKIQNLIPFNILTTGTASFVLNCLLIFAIVMIEKKPIQVIEITKLIQDNSLKKTDSGSTQLKELSNDIKTKIRLQHKGEQFTKSESKIVDILTNYKNWFLILPMLSIVVHFFKTLKNNQFYEKEDMKLILEHVHKIENAVIHDSDDEFKSKSQVYIKSIYDSLKSKNDKKSAIQTVTSLHDLLLKRELQLLNAAQQLISGNKNEKAMRKTMTHFIQQALIYANLCGKEDIAHDIILQIIGSDLSHSPQTISTSPIVDVKETKEYFISSSPTSQQISPNAKILSSYLNREVKEQTLSNMMKRIQDIDFETTKNLDQFRKYEITPVNIEIVKAIEELQSQISQQQYLKSNDLEFKHYYDTINLMYEKIVIMLNAKELITSATHQLSEILSNINDIESDERHDDSLIFNDLMQMQFDLKQNYEYFQTLKNEAFFTALKTIDQDIDSLKRLYNLYDDH